MARLATALTVCAGSIMLAAMATGMAGASETVNYTYDAKGRLVKVAHTGTVNTTWCRTTASTKPITAST